jgi:myo-inositol 2-dehydrogenase/D-chiro-inositol 1-dehydrogenase
MRHSSSNLLIVGRGSIGQKHEKNARRLGWNVTTVDPDKSVGADYKNVRSALSSKTPDTFSHAIIATPIECHLEGLKLLSKAGIRYILIEKPLAHPSSIFTARRLSLSYSSHIYMGFNWRFNSAIRRIKRKILQGNLGRIQVAQLSAREWLPKYRGNALLESGSHILDTARFLFGDLYPMAANLTRFGLFGPSDEASSILLRGRDNSDVYVHVNFVNSDDYDYQILVQGTKGTVRCCPDRTEPMHILELKAFLNGNTNDLATLNDGLHNLELLATIFRMAQIGGK